MILLLIMAAVNAQTLITHLLQLSHDHPLATSYEHATSVLSDHFSTLPSKLLSCSVSCSQWSDPRMAPLCKFMAVKAPGHAKAVNGFIFGGLIMPLRECVKKVSFPCPVLTVVKECEQQVYQQEDDLLVLIHDHVVGKYKDQEGGADVVDFVDGVTAIVKDLRPMSLIAKILVGVCMLGAILGIAFCIYWFLFGGNTTK